MLSVFGCWELLDWWPVVGRLPEAWGICEYGILLTRSRSFFPNHVWDGMLMMSMFMLLVVVFQCLYEIARFMLESLISILWFILVLPVARWEPMDVMFYHMMLFSYSWRTDVIMMIIFMVLLSRSCRIEMMLPWFCNFMLGVGRLYVVSGSGLQWGPGL